MCASLVVVVNARLRYLTEYPPCAIVVPLNPSRGIHSPTTAQALNGEPVPLPANLLGASGPSPALVYP